MQGTWILVQPFHKYSVLLDSYYSPPGVFVSPYNEVEVELLHISSS